MQAVMYTVIHDLALPNFEPDQNITERFILMIPGEVLDYYDYCPLSEARGEFNPKNYNAFPPEENAFKLSDTVPTMNPLGGGTTGKQFSNIYENILYMIDTSTTKSDPFAQKSYTDAIAYLTELVHDPKDNTAPNISRYELYYRYQKAYYDTKLRIKEWFDGNKTKLSYEEYIIWHKENYDSLQGYVSSSYIQWLVSGLKGPVEDKISLVDIKSEREEVEEARQALRAEEEPSLDGGSKYYPVHFVPSNWYQYLLASDNRLTADQIQAKIDDLTARRDLVQSMMHTNVPTKDELDKIEKKIQSTVSSEKEKMKESAKEYACYRYLCEEKRASSSTSKSSSASKSCSQYDKPSGGDPCSKLNEMQIKLSQQSQDIAQAQTAGNSAINQLTAYSGSNGSLTVIINQLNEEIAKLQRQLSTAPKPTPPDVEEARINGTGHLTSQEIEENWMSFTYDSETSASSTVTSSTTYKAAVSFSVGELFWSVGGSASYSRSTQDFAKQMKSAQVSVSAKLLRVTIERNWFRPSLFNVGKLRMEPGINPVSPGPMKNEKHYITKVNNGHYQLPEYTSGFLLAKDVSMSFRGVDSSAVSHALQESASASLSGSYGPFSASASFGYGHQSSSLKVSSQSYGLKIDIPGAQIIGYYTNVLPEFPAGE